VRILHAIHDFLPRHRAGSELYLYHLCREQALRHQVGVLCAELDPSRPQGAIVRREHAGLPVFELVNNWAFEHFEHSYRSPLVAEQVERVLGEFRPDVLHVHNLLNLSLDVPSLAKRRGIPVVATLHDYTLVCPSGGQRVHVAERHVCEQIDPERCSRCFAQSPFAGAMALGRIAGGASLPRPALQLARALGRRFPRAVAGLAARAPKAAAPTLEQIRVRLEHALDAAAAVDVFVAPSRSLADEHRRLGIPAAKLRVSDYGFPALGAAPARAPDPRAPLRIGFVGTLVWHKGVHVLLDAVAQLPRESFELLVFGSVETFPDYVASLRRQAEGLPVRFLGGFESDEAASIYARIDVLVVPSLWPENSPLVIHEAFQAGVPVIGARVGGIPELLRGGESGLLYDASSAAELADCLATLVASRERLAELAAAPPPVKPIEQDAAEWEALYAAVRSQQPSAAPA
jgi:glycosyltransferase involved in cell wall biosynthesis